MGSVVTGFIVISILEQGFFKRSLSSVFNLCYVRYLFMWFNIFFVIPRLQTWSAWSDQSGPQNPRVSFDFYFPGYYTVCAGFNCLHSRIQSSLNSSRFLTRPSRLGLQNTTTASLQKSKIPLKSVLDVTLNNLMVRLQ